MTLNQVEYEHIITQIMRWPPDQRLTLVRDVINTLPQVQEKSQREPTLPRALGLLVTSQPAPSDETVQQWLRERQVEQCSLVVNLVC